ncbi:MAG TPA: metalloregulator ArsR/SmtB family transcription factor [Terracidiphilus sp.]|jgi:DNA-binding transcriptional ArsR family regulator|nr:metalloregulator ArsR/SmtB family transcription factor [Terracidiphilus sp.]
MSRSPKLRRPPAPSLLFAALGDETRLALVGKLCSGEPHSIAELTAGSRLTRQAITKHLRVLAKAEIVRCSRSGRETRFELEPDSIVQMRSFLDAVSRQWDETLDRLKLFVEE